MDPLYGTQLTDAMMANPWMFDPSQLSNQFSNYNNQRIPYPPTYSGVPVSAATGQPIQSFLDWQKANPGGMSLNATPAQPQAAPPAAMQPNRNIMLGSSSGVGPGGIGAGSPNTIGAFLPVLNGGGPPSQLSQAAAAAPQASGPPNNWQAAINALANPGNPRTMGANVPLQTGYQPAGGVNQAFLNQAGAGQGMNQNFLSALRAIQGRPQG